ncbi:hypothetical protein ES703_38484 [subsurface metagenome]
MEVDVISQSVQAMMDILKLATTQSTDITEKLIKMNLQNTIGILQDEVLGHIIDIYA